MFQICKSGQHSNPSRPTPDQSPQVIQSFLPSIQPEQSSIQLEQSSIQLEQSEGTPETTADWGFAQREAESVSAKKELNQNESSPLAQTQMLTETERSRSKIAPNKIANQSQNSLRTELDVNEEPAKTKAKEKETSLQIVLKKKQQQHQSSPNFELNQLKDSQETKPAI